MISVFVGDRTLGRLDSAASNRYGRSTMLLPLYRLISCFWRVDNGEALLKSPESYKILSFDDQDDVIDTFSSLHHSIAVKHARDYDTAFWRQFYDSLLILIEAENHHYENVTKSEANRVRRSTMAERGMHTHFQDMLDALDEAHDKVSRTKTINNSIE